MCGITGYVGERPAEPLLLAGLAHLEYRGYDSAGIALAGDGEVETVRAVGTLDALREAVRERGGGPVALATRPALAGIGHTRWATHGAVTEANAHPHADDDGRVHVVLNGIVENFLALRSELEEAGATFRSQTDAEVVAHLIATELGDNLPEAVLAACHRLEGHFAFVALDRDDPRLLVAARNQCPLVIGRGDGEQFVASAIPAFLSETARVQHLEDGDVAIVRPSGVQVLDAAGVPAHRAVTQVSWDAETAEKGGHETFMLKEIHEQPAAVAQTLAAPRLDDGILLRTRRVVIVACGTSYHAGLVARCAIEQWARLPVEIDVASEFRYREPLVGPSDLVLGITQSGETADTLAAMRLARRRGARVVALTNVIGSQATREADATLLTCAGLEIGVAATKTFVAQLAALYCLALRLGEFRGVLSHHRSAALRAELGLMAGLIEDTLCRADAPARALAARQCDAPFFVYLGRHAGLPVALEGALKLKEVSYIPTEAYAAGEMKHGPIALLSPRTPVICVATDSPVLDKLASNMQEMRARGAHVVAVATAGNAEIAHHADEVIEVPRTDPLLQPLLAILPLQLLAYHVARLRGLDVDRPRNLAKTVTVE